MTTQELDALAERLRQALPELEARIRRIERSKVVPRALLDLEIEI